MPLKIHGPADIVEILPYLIGFTPKNSVTCLLLSSKTSRPAGVRIDRPTNPEEAELIGQITYPNHHFAAAVADADTRDDAVKTAQLVWPNWPLKTLQIVIAATPTEWATVSPNGDVSNFTPREPTPSIAAQAVCEGMLNPLPNRDEYLAQIAAAPDTAAATSNQVEKLTEHITQTPHSTRINRTLTLVQEILHTGDANPNQRTLLIAELQDSKVFDATLTIQTRHNAEAMLELWTTLAKTVDGKHAIPILKLAASAAFLSGRQDILNLIGVRANQIETTWLIKLLCAARSNGMTRRDLEKIYADTKSLL